MARGPVWIEAYEEYLIHKHIVTRNMTSKLSDDELFDYYCKMIEEKNLQDDAKKFVDEWCRNYR